MRICIIVFALALISGCAPLQPTAYRPVDRAGYGYHTIQAGPDTYQVSFAGNRATSREAVEAGMLYRAAELARQRGYERFALMERTLQERQRQEPRFFGPYPYNPRHYPRAPIYHYRPAYYDLKTTYRAVATMRLFRDQPPERSAGIYEVEDVLRRYRETLRGPTGKDSN